MNLISIAHGQNGEELHPVEQALEPLKELIRREEERKKVPITNGATNGVLQRERKRLEMLYDSLMYLSDSQVERRIDRRVEELAEDLEKLREVYQTLFPRLFEEVQQNGPYKTATRPVYVQDFESYVRPELSIMEIDQKLSNPNIELTRDERSKLERERLSLKARRLELT